MVLITDDKVGLTKYRRDLGCFVLKEEGSEESFSEPSLRKSDLGSFLDGKGKKPDVESDSRRMGLVERSSHPGQGSSVSQTVKMGGDLHSNKDGTVEKLASGMADTGGAPLLVQMSVERSSHIESLERSRQDKMAAVELSSCATNEKAPLRLLSRGVSDHRILHGQTEGCLMFNSEETGNDGRSLGCGSRRRGVKKWVVRRGSSAGSDVDCYSNVGTENKNDSKGGFFRASEVVKATC